MMSKIKQLDVMYVEITKDNYLLLLHSVKYFNDIKIGPKDGFVYILSINDGSIYRVLPSSFVSNTTDTKNK